MFFKWLRTRFTRHSIKKIEPAEDAPQQPTVTIEQISHKEVHIHRENNDAGLHGQRLLDESNDPQIEIGPEPDASEPSDPCRLPEASTDLRETVEGYQTAHQYLSDELSRVAALIKAYVIRRKGVTDAQRSPLDVATQLRFGWEDCPTDAKYQRSYAGQLSETTALARIIAARLQRTRADVAERFPLIRLRNIIEADTKQIRQVDKRDESVDSAQMVAHQLDVLLIALLEYHFSVYRSAIWSLSTDDGTVPGFLTMGMVAEICRPIYSLGDDRLAVFHPNMPLVRDYYVDLESADVPPSRRRLQIDSAIASYLLGSSDFDPELQDSVIRHENSVRWDQLFLDDAPLGHLRAVSRTVRRYPSITVFHGPAGTPFVSAARAILTASGRASLLVADLTRGAMLPNWREWTTRVCRQARLNGSAIFWQNAVTIIEAARTDARWQQLVYTPAETPVFISTSSAWDPDGVSSHRVPVFARIELPTPSREVRRTIWHHKLSKSGIPVPASQLDVTLDLLASFQFTEGQIADAIIIARGLLLSDQGSNTDTSESLYDACRRVSARGLVSFTQRIPPRKISGQDPLSTVILSAEGHQQLQELHDRIGNLNRVYYEYGFGNNLGLGRGLIALFSGPSGTGKTLAATVLASCHERDLYKVDMSAVVSKYVGETEKNLSRVFADAQSSNALLFFDEADAIFGKRGEVDKAQDRWANMEVNYLLQRVEEFPGVVILASNLKQNIDDAFLRRVQVLIDFKIPGPQDRQKILQSMFPPNVISPNTDELKTFCEQFELTGGNLKNVAVDAAFRAIQDQNATTSDSAQHSLKVGIEHLVLAAAREYRKLSRPVTLASFGRNYYAMVTKALRME